MFTSDGCEMTDQAKQNRRNFVTSMMGGSLAAAAAAGLPAAEAQAESLPPEGLSADDAMAHYWNKPLSELVDIGPYNATPAEMERHRVYANLVLALLHGYFNGNKDGETGEYPWQPSQRIAGTGTQSLYAGGRYLGHNICCIAVDGDGDIIDGDFNHNSIFNSSVDHAEARLIQRIFSLAAGFIHLRRGLHTRQFQQLRHGHIVFHFQVEGRTLQFDLPRTSDIEIDAHTPRAAGTLKLDRHRHSPTLGVLLDARLYIGLQMTFVERQTRFDLQVTVIDRAQLDAHDHAFRLCGRGSKARHRAQHASPQLPTGLARLPGLIAVEPALHSGHSSGFQVCTVTSASACVVNPSAANGLPPERLTKHAAACALAP